MSSHNITPQPQPPCACGFQQHQPSAHNRKFRQTCVKCAIPSVAMGTRHPQQQPSLSPFRPAEWVDTKPQKHWTHWTPTRRANTPRMAIGINHIGRFQRVKSPRRTARKHWTYWTLQALAVARQRFRGLRRREHYLLRIAAPHEARDDESPGPIMFLGNAHHCIRPADRFRERSTCNGVCFFVAGRMGANVARGALSLPPRFSGAKGRCG